MLKEYETRINALLKQYIGGSTMQLRWETPAEGKLHIKNIGFLQKELKLLKKEVQMQKKQRKAEYASERLKHQNRTNTGKIVGGGLGKFMRGMASSGRVDTRRHELNDMAQLDSTIEGIDRIIMQLDQAKLQIEQKSMALGK